MYTVLLVEDDPAVQAALVRALAEDSFAVRAVGTAAKALTEAAEQQPDLIILDLGLPDLDGSAALRMIRAVSQVPVIVATVRSDETSIVTLLNDGADDYVVKPFSSKQLIARMYALLRRTAPADPGTDVLEVGELRIDTARRTASLGGVELDLTRKEFDLLAYLAEQPGRVVSRRSLLDSVWREDERGTDQSIDVHVSWLRRKLGESAAEPRYLRTVRGVGLKLSEPT
ncbi:response regulator transcription factor [Haloechinothrix sp. LS1_15]|uniref:response regulator transcription factor n=1 Tax=Haloechinothrix sp. LS1_15 TaxID=2652248 RepID=UPI0029442390|nr:response regulator transcription factor [Haloechinothrix sp. LS1_15]MDV6013013.1 response regulator transcription factor [Haloechinothrix sp. LS1_15]